MAATNAAILLPSGVWHGASYYRTVTVRSLCGDDERFWLELPTHWSHLQRVNALAARCLVQGDAAPLLPGIDSLTIGDREALLLHWRRLTFGNRMACVLSCPHCGEKLDLDLYTDDLLLPPYQAPQPHYEAQLADGYRVRFRLPTSADQIQISELAQVDPAAAAQALLDRCIDTVSYQDQPCGRLPPSLNAAIAEQMAQLDPQAELNIQMVCPLCATAFTTLLDMAHFLATEVATHSYRLDREIHTLALYYHWSEAELLRLPVRRRQSYLRLLDEAFGGGEFA